MALSIRMALKIPHIPLLNAQESQAILRREVGTAVQGIIEDIATQARQRTPVGVSGILRASIGTRVTMGTDASHLARGEVFTGAQAPYAIYVEEGTRPHWPPRAPIELWAQRVLGNAKLWFVIARAISRRAQGRATCSTMPWRRYAPRSNHGSERPSTGRRG
jgi:hypothetical protein